MYSKKIDFEVVGKGRKYFKIRYSPDHNEFQLVINELTRHFVVGQQVTGLLCEFEVKHSGYGKKTTATAVDPAEFAARAAANAELEKAAEIKRWRGYVEDKLPSGVIYQKGLDRLKELGFDTTVYADRIAGIREADRKIEVKRWSGYCEEAALDGRDYTKGLARLKELGAPEIAQRWRDKAAEVRQERSQAERQEKATEAKREADAGVISYQFCSPSWDGRDLTHLQIGDVYAEGDKFYTILTRSRRRVYEDGLSFGLADDEGEIVSGKARLATEEEAAPVIAAIAKAAARKAERQAISAERKALVAQIREQGDRPEHTVGDRLLDTVTIYGGGDWFEVTPEGIWYCLNNGSDGADWSQNNVKTWGAGAIGWRIDFDQAIADRINALVQRTDNYNEDK